jgi:hypothetical protein
VDADNRYILKTHTLVKLRFNGAHEDVSIKSFNGQNVITRAVDSWIFIQDATVIGDVYVSRVAPKEIGMTRPLPFVAAMLFVTGQQVLCLRAMSTSSRALRTG